MWAIVKIDKKNRNDIISFIKGIPQELLDDIRLSIKNMNEKSTDFHESIEFSEMPSKDNPSIYYGYRILDEELELKKEINSIEIFELMLSPFRREYIKYMENGDEESIACLSNNKIDFNPDGYTMTEDEVEYYFMKSPFGYFVLYNKELFDGRFDLVKLKPLNINKMPEDLNREDILCRKLSRK